LVNSSQRVALVSLGGTIAMVPQAGGGVVPALSAADLLAGIPGLADLGVTVEVNDFRQLPGASLRIADLLELVVEIDRQLASGVAGIVITQGTDTIEETAYVLDLVYRADAPIVVTGAMRGAAAAGADGPANVISALRVAASPHARGLGCVVVFADEIHAARYVRKTHTTSTAAFTSYPGPIGHVAEDHVATPMRLTRGPAIAAADAILPARTALVTMTLGDTGDTLRILGDQLDGLVVAAFGVGHVPADCVPVLEDLASRIPVVLASRTGAGPVLSKTYGFPGSESDLLGRGLISAGALHPLKARILLQLLTMTGADRTAVQRAFAQAGGRGVEPTAGRAGH
jgi:L-asparaginase